MSEKPTYEELEQQVKELENDIIECRRWELDLKNKDKKLREHKTYIDAMGDTLIVLNLERKVIKLNKAAIQLLGYTEEDIPHLSFETIFPEKEHEKHYAEMKIALDTETIRPFETLLLTKDGEEIPVLISGTVFKNARNEPIGFVGVCRNIPERKQVEETLRESEERYRTLAENSLVGFWQITLEGYTTYINPAMCSMIGIEGPEALSGQTYHSFFTTESLEIIDHERTIRPKGKGSSYEAEIIGKNGGRRNVMICGAPLLSTKGKLHGYIATFTDITDRKRAEEKLRKAHDELEHRVKERTRELEIKTKSLEEINTAIKVLLKKREEDKTELENNVLTNVKELIEPYFEKIEKTKLDDQQEAFLSIIESNLNEIISPFTRKMSLQYLNLTPTEIQIANLIRHGSATKKIAELMNISPRTVETHRKNIRRKVGLKAKKANLRSHLLSLY